MTVMHPDLFVDFSISTLYKLFVRLLRSLFTSLLISFISVLIYFFQNRFVAFLGQRLEEVTKRGFSCVYFML